MKLLKKGIITDAAALAVGGIGAGKVYTMSANFIKNEKVRGVVPVVLGAVLMGQKGKFVQGVGAGMVAVGSQRVVASFIPGLAGYGEDDVIEGLNDYPSPVNGSVINGGEFDDEFND